MRNIFPGLTLHGLLRIEQAIHGSVLNKNRLRLSRIIFERLKIVHELLSKSEKQDIFSQENLF